MLQSSGISGSSAAQVVPAAAGRTYRLRAWTRAWEPADASKVHLRLEFLNKDKNEIGGPTEVLVSRTDEFQLNSVKAQSPTGTKFVRVTALARKRSDNGCADIGFDPAVAFDAMKLQYAL